MHIQGELFLAPSQNYLTHLVGNSASRVRSDFLRERLGEGSLVWGFLIFSRQFEHTAFENHASTVKDKSTIMSDPLTLMLQGN